MSHVLIHCKKKTAGNYRSYIVSRKDMSNRLTTLIDEAIKYQGRATVDSKHACSAVLHELGTIDASDSLTRGASFTVDYACTLSFDPL